MNRGEKSYLDFRLRVLDFVLGEVADTSEPESSNTKNPLKTFEKNPPSLKEHFFLHVPEEDEFTFTLPFPKTFLRFRKVCTTSFNGLLHSGHCATLLLSFSRNSTKLFKQPTCKLCPHANTIKSSLESVVVS